MKNILPLFCFVLLFSYCNDSTDPVPDPVSLIPDCCSSQPILADIGDGRIYVPNIFSPNFDGVNDQLWVHSNSDIEQKISFEISTEDGQVVYQVNDVFPQECRWDGKVNGVVERALYNVKVTVENTDGTTEEFTGKVCSFYCSENQDPEPQFAAFDNCFYGLQHNGSGEIDQNQSSGEEGHFDCFE